MSLPTKADLHISKRNVYHQAGYAAAIYIGNKQKNLPAVHFNMTIKPSKNEKRSTGRFARIQNKHIFKIGDGRLLPNLSCSSFEVSVQRLSTAQRQQCICAIEADVINILAGALAEAKYIALRDGEIFNANLLYLDLGALKFYGGSTDMEIIDEYMECLYQDDHNKRQKKMAELFLAAYSFVNDYENWFAISKLAETILSNPRETFACEELIAILNSDAPLDFPLYVHQSFNNSGEWFGI